MSLMRKIIEFGIERMSGLVEGRKRHFQMRNGRFKHREDLFSFEIE